MSHIARQLKLLAKKGEKPTIAIGITKPIASVVASLKAARAYAHIVIVGSPVKGFESVKSTTVEDELISLYAAKKVDGIVRGQADAFKLRDALCRAFGYASSDFVDIALVGDLRGHAYCLGPVSQGQGWTREQKIIAVKGMAHVLRDLGISPKVGVLTAVRPGSRGRNFFLDLSYEVADDCVQWCVKKKIDANNYNIELETALEDGCNIIIPPNGIAGNQMLRMSTFVAGLPLYAMPLIGVKEHIVESFRNEKNFLNYFIYLAARIHALGAR